MKHTRREAFDEWRSLHWQFQLFEPRLWRWGWRWQWGCAYGPLSPADPESPMLRPVQKGWVLALPFVAIRRF